MCSLKVSVSGGTLQSAGLIALRCLSRSAAAHWPIAIMAVSMDDLAEMSFARFQQHVITASGISSNVQTNLLMVTDPDRLHQQQHQQQHQQHPHNTSHRRHHQQQQHQQQRRQRQQRSSTSSSSSLSSATSSALSPPALRWNNERREWDRVSSSAAAARSAGTRTGTGRYDTYNHSSSSRSSSSRDIINGSRSTERGRGRGRGRERESYADALVQTHRSADTQRQRQRQSRDALDTAARRVAEGDGSYEALLALDEGVKKRGVSERAKLSFSVYQAAKKDCQGPNKRCVICMENIRNRETLVKLPCGHKFHENCLWTWFEENRTCPFCRKVVEE